MVNEKILKNERILEICKKSGDIKPGAVFPSVEIAESVSGLELVKNQTVICCGKVNDNEILFKTKDGRYYFSLLNGWGEQDGVLYGLCGGIFYNFRRPMTERSVIEEIDRLGDYHSWGGALRYMAQKIALEKIISVIRK